jgi:lipopolysaccharide/colanic/teichoic acid biosynthesis glycosyltransferase
MTSLRSPYRLPRRFDAGSGQRDEREHPPLTYQVLKRLLDLIGALTLLILMSPLWLAIAILIKLDSAGPILFRQVRVGQDGRLFVCFKFRTMHHDADDTIHRRYIEGFINSSTPPDARDSKAVFKLQQDPRITSVGRWLRRTSLDELPNLISVVRGDMSLVGPRPALPYEVERYQSWQLQRLRGKPGITGVWQVYGRSRVTFEEMVLMDIRYLDRASLWVDVKLLILTIPATISGIGAA